MTRIKIYLCSFLLATGSFFFLTAHADNFSVERQFGMSFDQIKNAAAQGDPDAEYALGYMYYYGKGTPRDEMSAKMWIEKAAAQGQPQATKALQMLGLAKNPKEASAGPQDPINHPLASNETVTSTIDNSNSQAAMQSNSATQSNADMQSNSSDQSNSTAQSDATAQPNSSMQSNMQSSSPPTSVVDDTSNTGASEDMQNSIAKSIKEAKSSGGKNLRASDFSGSKVTIHKLLKAPSHYYTLQLLGSHRESDLTSFVQKHNLQNKTAYFRSTAFKGKPWYVLVYGIYPTDAKAEAAIKQLPSGIRKLDPWVKSIRMVQQELHAYNK